MALLTDNVLRNASIYCTLIMIIMCIIGIIGNSLSLFIYRGPSFRKRSINILLAALSATDLCLCTLAIPVFSISLIQSASKYLTGHILIFAYPVTLMLQSMSVWLLVGITIDRYLAVCHPFKARVHCTCARAKLSICIIVFFSVAYNFVRFWEFKFDDADGIISLEDSIVPLLRGDHLFMLLYQNIATLISQFFIPLIVLCVLNLRVAQTILQASEQRRQLVASEKCEYNTARMMFFIVIVFIFCYALSMILNLVEILNEDLFRQPIGYLLNDINNILVVINSSSSFIFYTFYSTSNANLTRSSEHYLFRKIFYVVI
ncbi:unnamed protein product [Dracunculus medinensis]|uniref:G-protein coupled receptors family 1 profile domain-containing protein n=1 Tax=Dracunculus medinensis TaxID=318479 RepID=A0A3P7Q0A9_DRAME|nr:unnamed protein product [Dracunculus medinensis]